MSDDICNAIDWVGCTTNSKDHAHNIRMKAHKALNELRAENEKLREALKPLANELTELEKEIPEWVKKTKENDLLGLTYVLTLGDLRRARALLNGDN